ncbi:cell division protein ZapA [Alicyclobacillus fastidiosus]|uniref:Cell division protein ZapA n=1 Tax=Alicyclobacillus fastidiosus TaxID=392011 RepID=A0ABY6ZL15_9BACL|nr:cell division protein ZapA [Alicyclobacillus fastidiosus]WAH43620.1 cell division protein ZapA [Alicyclobacillus fastidiosus]GMA59813.1 cell division protein ZapA [Alicyclobacillus fastidiosus]
MDNVSVNRVRVTIHGMDYTLKGTAPTSHLNSVANTVDKMMTEISSTSTYMDERRVAVLTALNLADELERLKQEYQELLSLLDDKTRGDGSP